MGFNISNNSLQETCFTLAIVGVVVSIVAVALRFVAVRRANRKPSWEDWFSVLAVFFFILYVIPLLYLLSVMNGNTKWTKEEVVHIKKAGYSMGPQFCMQQLFAKLSLLFLYYRIFHVKQSFVYCVWFFGIVQVAWSISTYLVHWMECIPARKLWEPTLKGHCINSEDFLAGGETPNSLVDFALIGLAIWMVQSLKVKTTVKIKLFSIFIIGGLAGILGFVKIGYGFSATTKSKVEVLDPIWATVQQTCSVICCCAPVYKPLIPELGFFAQMRSFTSSVFTRSRTRSRGSKAGSHPPQGKMDTDPISVGRIWKPHSNNDWVELDESVSRKTSSTQIIPPV
ncbi:Satratoxin biosynthesis SC1 cluster protein 4 [Lachnellula cervina]|uniref:Satratoxin biosynthesis SC1 cluster protein 4 n=1 Tax=Lachnellula cervina TaxID=1316786 RepID=A0A7D8Z0Z0_9HELO|nr:Satratoxin biosynthesis SC1 cluster protein 4 [Lachnellula cervina]